MKPINIDADKEKLLWYKLKGIDPMSALLVISEPHRIVFYVGGYTIASYEFGEDDNRRNWFANVVDVFCSDIDLIRKLVNENPVVNFQSTSIVFYPLYMDEDKLKEKVNDIIDTYLEKGDENRQQSRQHG